MSFTGTIKKEVTKLDCNILEYMAELSGIVRNNANVLEDIVITVENGEVAKRIFDLIFKLYDVTPAITVRKRFSFNNNLSYILHIREKVEVILRDLSIVIDGEYQEVPKNYLINDDECLRAYLRGVFIATGSVNDPKTSGYHLEFIIGDGEYAKFISSLLDKFSLNNKVIKREKNYMVYIKESEKISDFLRLIRAYNGVMYFEDIRIYRDYKNMSNRLNNCEIANMDKIFMTANKQLRDIAKLKEYDMIDIVDNRIKEAIDYRVKYPESSLQELADIMSKELGYSISKSGLNHRFRKIRDMVLKLDSK